MLRQLLRDQNRRVLCGRLIGVRATGHQLRRMVGGEDRRPPSALVPISLCVNDGLRQPNLGVQCLPSHTGCPMWTARTKQSTA